MKLRMRVSMAGADFALSPGETTERFTDEDALRLVQADYAVVITGEAETAARAPAPETRAGDPPDGAAAAGMIPGASADGGAERGRRTGAARGKAAIHKSKAADV